MSYRATGVAVLECKNESNSILHMECLTNPEFGYGFHSLTAAMNHMKYDTMPVLHALKRAYDINLCVIEMPCFTQNARSALAIGMCWGFAAQFNASFVEPSALKDWSGSKKGDKKTMVKNKVLERIAACSHVNNNNIVDALGLVFMTSDLIRTMKYDI